MKTVSIVVISVLVAFGLLAKVVESVHKTTCHEVIHILKAGKETTAVTLLNESVCEDK
jgi:hypothetical protein